MKVFRAKLGAPKTQTRRGALQKVKSEADLWTEGFANKVPAVIGGLLASRANLSTTIAREIADIIEEWLRNVRWGSAKGQHPKAPISSKSTRVWV